jgi:hypothetical protein
MELHKPTSWHWCDIFPSWRRIIGGYIAKISGIAHQKALEIRGGTFCISSFTVKYLDTAYPFHSFLS